MGGLDRTEWRSQAAAQEWNYLPQPHWQQQVARMGHRFLKWIAQTGGIGRQNQMMPLWASRRLGAAPEARGDRISAQL
ncbi:hypothetical protein C8255_15660 [filamentous cyanobacterium CCP3]|nr:hypothetical protein C8255_15660 [filamentous cyanobacterium CCP3]